MDLNDLMSRFYGLVPRERTDATDAVVRDSFDTDEAMRLIDGVPPLSELNDRLGEKVAHSKDLTADLVSFFLQRDPQVRLPKEMGVGHTLNASVMGDLSMTAEVSRLRDRTSNNAFASALAALAIEEELHGAVRNQQEIAELTRIAEEKIAIEGRKIVEVKRLIIKAGDVQAADPNDPQLPALLAGLEAQLDELTVYVGESAQAAADLLVLAHEIIDEVGLKFDRAARNTSCELKEQDDLANAYGYSQAELDAMAFAERMELMKKLRNTKIGRYADLIGRFKRLSAAEQSRRSEYGRDQLAGTELSGDPTRVVGQEWAKGNAHPMMKASQLSKLVNGDLLSRKFVGKERVGKGAIIVCRDESGSMSATDDDGIPRWAWATAMSLALLDQAKSQGRDFVAVSFSDNVKVWRFPGGESNRDQLMEFGEHFIGKGTNFERAFDAAIGVLRDEYNSHGRPKGDIVFITDDGASVSEAWRAKYDEAKQQLAFRTFGIAVACDDADVLASLSDDCRSVTEFADPAEVADLFRTI